MSISRDYTQEVGLPSTKKTMPRALAVVVLAIVAVGISFGVVSVVRHGKERHAAEQAAAAPAASATATPAPAPAPAPAGK